MGILNKLISNPITLKKVNRFKSIKRGYYSFIAIATLITLSLFAELFVNSKAIVVKYNGNYYFPTYTSNYNGSDFGLDYKYECNYRQLKEHFSRSNSGNFVILPFIPYNPFENDLKANEPPPTPPSFDNQHYLGTDQSGRDIAARLVYGFRIAILFSLFLLIITYVVGITLGCVMGFFGGWFDLIVQRLIEIWTNIPFLYVVIIVASIVNPNFWSLAIIMVFFGWMGMTWYMRTSTYKERSREYVSAARALGASNTRIIFNHILPNSVSVIVTFIPFSISSGIIALTSLDYLGYGLPPPTPSWGDLLDQGSTYLNKPWILNSVVFSMVIVLTLVTFIGEAVREAFDPKKFTIYE